MSSLNGNMQLASTSKTYPATNLWTEQRLHNLCTVLGCLCACQLVDRSVVNRQMTTVTPMALQSAHRCSQPGGSAPAPPERQLGAVLLASAGDRVVAVRVQHRAPGRAHHSDPTAAYAVHVGGGAGNLGLHLPQRCARPAENSLPGRWSRPLQLWRVGRAGWDGRARFLAHPA